MGGPGLATGPGSKGTGYLYLGERQSFADSVNSVGQL